MPTRAQLYVESVLKQMQLYVHRAAKKTDNQAAKDALREIRTEIQRLLAQHQRKMGTYRPRGRKPGQRYEKKEEMTDDTE